MKTTPLPQSAWNDEQAAGSQAQSATQSTTYYQNRDKKQQNGCASNDAIYKDSSNNNSNNNDVSNHLNNHEFISHKLVSRDQSSTIGTEHGEGTSHGKVKSPIDCGYKKSSKNFDKSPANVYHSKQYVQLPISGILKNDIKKNAANKNNVAAKKTIATAPNNQIPERIFMNGLIKHTAIALAIIIPLAAFSAYAAPQISPINAATNTTTVPTIEPSAIIYKSASTPTTVESVDLEQYAGTWYEIGRLPMYFQRKCASDVTATYTGKTDGSGIDVLNQCRKQDGSMMSANGLAKAVDSSGSKLKVTFLPSWIRWLPIGKADYWVLARDANYQTALVGTPDKKYLWLLARSPNISQQTYAKYRQIAQQQGYDLKEFKLTTQTNQNVTLVP